MLSIGSVLEKMDIFVHYFTPHPISPTFSFIPGKEKVKTTFDYGTYDLCLFVDFAPLTRIRPFTQGHEDYFAQQQIIVIDHHQNTPPDNVALALIDPNTTSNCEHMFEIIAALRPELIDSDIATVLYTGIMTDTYNFMYCTDTIHTMSIALELLKHGADKKTIMFHLQRKRTFAQMKFLGELMQRMHYADNILRVHYSKQDEETYQIDKEEADYATHFLQDIYGPHVLVVFKFYGQKTKISFRSRYAHEAPDGVHINVGKLANSLFAGG